ncbi:cyclic nucleotide-binding domain-containing protein [Rhodospirillum sp. A1_3_36]|uniref:cyclic nucleotide-binding domain-containing protein n=1 Tax=Rhodospirillum sp. A1_3_36 TaxID=3391666 RepID=UPI0039A53B17
MFESLSDEAIEEILLKADRVSFAQGEVIVWTGEPSEHLFVVVSGIVAITAERPWTPEATAWAFFKPGECLGEVGVIQGVTRTATASAVIDVETLRIGRKDFLELMHCHANLGFNMSRMIAQRLAQNAARFKGMQRRSRLVAVIGVRRGVGASTISRALKYFLGDYSQKTVGYAHCIAEEVDPRKWDFPSVVQEGIEDADFADLPAAVRVTAMVERLCTAFDVAVVSLHASADRSLVTPIIERADEVVLVTDGDLRAGDLREARSWASRLAQSSLTTMCTILNQVHEGDLQPDLRQSEDIDYILEHLPGLKRGPPSDPVRAAFGSMGSTIGDRMGKPHAVGLYIPTTIDVDQTFDAQAIVEKTCDFLGQCFGGATVSKSRGVWRSDDKGLVGEDIFVVRSHCNEEKLNAHVPSITAYMKQLKGELSQEAMAMEIDGRLIIL